MKFFKNNLLPVILYQILVCQVIFIIRVLFSFSSFENENNTYIGLDSLYSLFQYAILTAGGDYVNDIIFRLFDFINNSKIKDTNYFIALTLLHDLKNIPNMYITTLADKCYTSPAAITRFCKRIGFTSFQEFKDCIQMFISNSNLKAKDVNLLEKEEVVEKLQEALYSKIESWLKSSRNTINTLKSYKIISLIHDYKKVSFYGTQLSQAISQDLQLRLIKYNKFVSAFSDIQEQLEDAENLDEDSIAIVVSPSGRFINANNHLLKIIKESKCTLIVITNNTKLPFLNNADIVFYLNGDSNKETGFSSERFSLMYFFDFIAAYYIESYCNG